MYHKPLNCLNIMAYKVLKVVQKQRDFFFIIRVHVYVYVYDDIKSFCTSSIHEPWGILLLRLLY